MKNFIKKVITKFYCFIYKAKYVEGLYMGLGCKVVGSQRITICGGGKNNASGNDCSTP